MSRHVTLSFASPNFCVCVHAACRLFFVIAICADGKQGANFCGAWLTFLRVLAVPQGDAGAGGKAGTGVDGEGVGEVDGWLVYDEEKEFVRQGVIRPRSLES